jgi:hypothetical protein
VNAVVIAKRRERGRWVFGSAANRMAVGQRKIKARCVLRGTSGGMICDSMIEDY